MRAQLLSYLTANLTGTIKTSQEMPFEQGGTANYLRNMRRVYLDEPFAEQAALINTLDDLSEINQSITRVRGYLAVDAKNRNADLDSTLSILSQALRAADISDSFRKEFDYTATIDDDRIVYEFEYRYYTLA